jgi:hypothetical protein
MLPMILNAASRAVFVSHVETRVFITSNTLKHSTWLVRVWHTST